MSALNELLAEIEKHGVMRGHASLIQKVQEEAKAVQLLVEHHKEHHAEEGENVNLALRAMIKYIEFAATTHCCPICGGYRHHDSACLLAACIYPEHAISYKRETHDTWVNELLYKVDNSEGFAYLRDYDPRVPDRSE